MKQEIHTFVVLAYKKSDLLEECIKSVIHQSLKTNVIIATSTPNEYIKTLANKYDLEIIVNDNPMHIGGDFDFAINCVKSKLITIAHQDDIYDYNYALNIVDQYNRHKDSIIIFSDYYEIRGNKKVYRNKNLTIKRILLFPLRIKAISKLRFVKRLILSFGCPICCPAVTFVKANVPKVIFSSNFKCNVDWNGWEKLSNIKGKFVFIPKKLMGHRIHNDSTTTAIINDNIRTKEDLEMLRKFWPITIAKFINKFYVKAEKSNNI